MITSAEHTAAQPAGTGLLRILAVGLIWIAAPAPLWIMLAMLAWFS
ncbi:hypothetical protein [Oricola sp.]